MRKQRENREMTTQNEKNLLKAIAYHEMAPSNTGRPETIADTGTFCWVDDFAAEIGLTVPQTKGVLGSLVAKNLVTVNEWDQGDTVVDFTPAGFAEFLLADPVTVNSDVPVIEKLVSSAEDETWSWDTEVVMKDGLILIDGVSVVYDGARRVYTPR